jgi:outer membrane protein OmpA-like peptidoglycan-associated protein
MKKLKLIIAIMLIGFSITKTMAQVTDAVNTTTQNSEWQFSLRAGFDQPLFDEDFKYIDYKGGLMFGLSANHYWNWFGIQADFDYMNNSPVVEGLNGSKYFDFSGPIRNVSTYSDILTQKENIRRMFVGVGPAFRYLSSSKKFQSEFSVLAGLGFVNGGEILVEGKRQNGSQEVLTYHSGFDNVSLFTGKALARFTYFFNNNWGINAGAYYMKHFGGAEESSKNTILKSTVYGAGLTHPVYYAEINSFTTQAFENNVGGTYTAFGEDIIIRDFQEGEADLKRKIDLASAGVFVGVTYRIVPGPKVKKEEVARVVAPPVKEEPKIVEKKYCLQVTAKDKFTGEIIPNTDVALKNSKGEIITTAKTDGFGVTKFCDISLDDYTIDGVYEEVALEGAVAKKSEFKNDLTLKKEVIYSDRDFIIKGKAVECNTTTPIEGLSVVLEKDDKSYKKISLTDAKGTFNLKLPVLGVYSLFGKKDGYFSQIEKIDASNYNRDKTLFVKLEICAEKADCGKAIGLKNILFDLDKYVIKEEAKVELNKLVRFMLDNPDVKVEVGSHTDCRSSAKYNQTLSQNRANASVAYIISQGVSKDKISGKGYGESQLLNECADGVKCAEELHSINRRTEMKVICPPKK